MKNAKADSQAGFGLIEFLVSTAILLVVASSVFGLISDVQRKTSYQPEVQSVLNNTRLAMHIVGRHIRQAGNDPLDTGLSGVTIISESAVKLQSDITGSAGPEGVSSRRTGGVKNGRLSEAPGDKSFRP